MGGDKTSGESRVTRKKIEIDDEKLIECVRKNPSLYELDHINYGSGVTRAKIWVAIAAELKVHPLFCKKRWGNIRDNYRKAMKKYNIRLAEGHKKLKKYKFCDQLSFLKDQIEGEDNHYNYDNNYNDDSQSPDISNLEVKSEPDTDLNDGLSFHDLLNQQHSQYYEDYNNQPMNSILASQLAGNHNIEENTTDCENLSQVDPRVSECDEQERTTSEVDNNEDLNENSDEEEEANVEKQPSPKIETIRNQPIISPLRLRSKRKLKESSNCNLNKTRTKSMRYIVERVEEDTSTERHPVDAFLAGIAPTLKGLSSYYLSLAKTQIYSIVQEYEMAMIIEQRNESLGY